LLPIARKDTAAYASLLLSTMSKSIPPHTRDRKRDFRRTAFVPDRSRAQQLGL
jgi:hypothetical protein